jgi:outer membrane protein assembly factor BamB
MHRARIAAALLLLAAALLAAFPRPATSDESADVLRAAGVGSGLAVHLGSSDGRLEAGLTNGGRIVVHGLALDDRSVDAARHTLLEKGLYGVASVERWAGAPALPYADNLVNLLVADLDALGKKAPRPEEILRVVCPGGVAYLKRDGQWDKTVKPRPKEMDDWTHLDHGPEANGVSHDRLVRQPNFVQWVCGVQPIKLGGNPAAFVNLTGIRVAGGRAFFDYVEEPGKGYRRSMLAGRDAFSGVPLWARPRDVEAGMHRWQLVAAGDRVYTPLKRNGPLVALDAATGEPAVSYTAAAAVTNKHFEATQVRLCGDTVLLNVDATLYALDAASGKLRWKYADESGGSLLFPSASAAAKKVFVAVGPDDPQPRARWPWAVVRAVVCLDLPTGRVVWRNTDVAGKPVGQLVYDDGLLALFAGCAIGGRDAKDGGWVSTIGVADGKLHGEATFKSAWNDSMYNAVIRGGAVYYAGHTHLYKFDPGSAKVDTVFASSYNQRCNRFCATDSLFLMGYVTYLDRDGNGTLQSASRAGCALGATPANGMIYLTPNACQCFTMLRGYMALSPEAVREPVADGRRLETGGGGPPALPARTPAPTGPIADDWGRQSERETARGTEPVALGGGLSLVAVVHQHRVEARDDKGSVKWAFTAGGRVTGAPLVHDGTVFFGSHDGWVYALKAADGSLRWRYLAAPYERKMMAFGQLESSWPVYGVALHDGLVCASAGLHPELGGGMHVCGLDPKSGAAKFRRVLRKSPARVETKGGRSNVTVVPQSFLNEAPKSDGHRLTIGGFAFDPKESDDELQKRLDTPPPKKK